MSVFKFIGSGAIVRQFLKRFASSYSDTTFAIYARKRAFDFPHEQNVQLLSIEDFAADTCPTFVCCSVNEEDILRKTAGDKSRSVVARENIRLIRSIIERQIFNQGHYFVLTNPSEIVGQYIAEHSENPNIYSLGLSVDQVRYQNILAHRNTDVANCDFQLAGNHSHRSFPVFKARSPYSRRELDALYEQYNCEVQNEFDGFRPPIQSGADAIHHLVKAFVDQTPIPLSGQDQRKGTFVGGVFHTKTRQFAAVKATGKVGEQLYQEILGHHEQLMLEMRT